ncbi:hypothetical protein BA896_007420 [Janthinobacterium lividum]|uniref:Uncharacterized protein n=1 Tax=Janthinobacterium lividum TaxID=29581 RepID=A0A1E8PRV9_9BURK|nr:hypothetical protein BA896_007420 [Janthinobacterium lividum]
MFFSTNEIAQLAITFPWGHTAQVKMKAAKHGVAPDDIIQEGREIILEKAPVFDPAKGTLCQFVFGHLEKRMLRQLGAHTFAVSIDSDEHFGDSTRSSIANLEPPAVYDNDFPPPSDQSKISKALSIASFVSGKSTADLARALGVTPRRVRQILQQFREQYATSNQSELFFDEVCE